MQLELERSADRNSTEVFPLQPCIFEGVHVLALAEVCVVVAGSTEREAGAPGAELLAAAVPGLKQLTNSRRPLVSPRPPNSFQFLVFLAFFTFTLLWLVPFFCTLPLFLLSTRGSPWQCAGDRKWVSGSAQAAGSRLRLAALWVKLESLFFHRGAQHTPDINSRIPARGKYNSSYFMEFSSRRWHHSSLKSETWFESAWGYAVSAQIAWCEQHVSAGVFPSASTQEAFRHSAETPVHNLEHVYSRRSFRLHL